jgi:hypothetical protein
MDHFHAERIMRIRKQVPFAMRKCGSRTLDERHGLCFNIEGMASPKSLVSIETGPSAWKGVPAFPDRNSAQRRRIILKQASSPREDQRRIIGGGGNFRTGVKFLVQSILIVHITRFSMNGKGQL